MTKLFWCLAVGITIRKQKQYFIIIIIINQKELSKFNIPLSLGIEHILRILIQVLN